MVDSALDTTTDVAPEPVHAPDGAEQPQGAPQEPADAASALSVEDRALSMGWTPKEQFRGAAEKWVDAETFVKRGEEYLPFVKANNRRLEREVEKANDRMAKLEQALSRSVEHMSRAEQRGYERARRDLETQLEQAADQGDREGVKAITKEIVDLEKQASGPAPKPTDDTALMEFKAANPWFEKDRVMTAAAVEIAQELADNGVVDPKIQLGEVTKRIRAEFPHKFTNPRREQPAAVEGGALGQRKAGKGYADLPPDAKQMCDEFVRDKIITREKYVSEFFKEPSK